MSEHMDAVCNLSWSPAGTRVVTASRDGTGRVWDAFTGRTPAVLSGHEGKIVRLPCRVPYGIAACLPLPPEPGRRRSQGQRWSAGSSRASTTSRSRRTCSRPGR
ncbi:hypothetical protein [Streptosporangium sp. NBC_01469]|uniref:hypothetical protein n=1 Tax=unclassified Streptosporangium TaxID=2632669 RepID=UPI003FCDCCCA